MEANIIIERINNRMTGMFNEFSYAKNAMIYNAYTTVLNWWMSQAAEDEHYSKYIKSLYNAERVDQLDFFSSTSYAIAQIYSGRESFDHSKLVRKCNEYINMDGIMIQTHNLALMTLSIILIDYAFKCCNKIDGNFLTFSKQPIEF